VAYVQGDTTRGQTHTVRVPDSVDVKAIRYVQIHALWHAYASLLLQQRESMAYIRDQLGHHSIQVTVDIYGHLVPGGIMPR
jgi:site-specific recombinase XerD